MEGLREFFEVNGYVVELMICNFLFCLSQKRRRRYVPRLLLAVAVMLLSAPALNSVQSDSGLTTCSNTSSGSASACSATPSSTRSR